MFNGAAADFALADGGWPLALVRGLAVAALFTSYGALLFRSLLLPAAGRHLGPNDATSLDLRLRRLARSGLAAQVPLLLVWLTIQAMAMAGLDTPFSTKFAFDTLPTVAAETEFGHILLLQLALAAVTFLLTLPLPRFRLSQPLRPRHRSDRLFILAAAASATAAAALQAGHGHALSMIAGPSWLLASETLHLLAAGGWLGGLVPLALVLRHAPPRAARAVAERFSSFGTVAVLALVLSAAYQGDMLVGGFFANDGAGLVGTAYGWVILVKFLLLIALLGVAAVNRWRWTPALALGTGARKTAAGRGFRRSVRVETGLGLLVVLAAGVLTNLAPAMHVQPVWPFTEQPSLVTVQEDPDFRAEVIRAALGLALGLLLLSAGALAWIWTRWRLAGGLAMAAGLALAAWALPHFDLLFVEAHPTSFYRSPTNFAATSITRGEKLFPENCAACHGAAGRGDGPQAKTLPVLPADLTAGHLWGHSDGEMFWWLSHGIENPDAQPGAPASLAMPGFEDRLDEDDRWALIDYIRAHNAGLARAAAGHWTLPVAAPTFELSCDFGGKARRLDLSGLRGRTLRLVFGDGPVEAPPPRPALVTIRVSAKAVPDPQAGVACAAVDALEDPVIARAYAAVTGLAPEALGGATILIDRNAWLRELGTATPNGTAWSGHRTFAALLADIAARPLLAEAAAGMRHHMDGMSM